MPPPPPPPPHPLSFAWRWHQSMAMHIFNRRLNGTIDLNESDRNIRNNYRIAQSTGNNLMVDYDCIDAMVSMPWYRCNQIVKSSRKASSPKVDAFDGIFINVWKNRKVHSDEKIKCFKFHLTYG